MRIAPPESPSFFPLAPDHLAPARLAPGGLLLAIDTSCDESSVAILRSARHGAPAQLLADVVASHAPEMERFGGVVPEVASREHLRALPRAVHTALEAAGVTWDEIDAVVATERPGLIGALLVGISFAKAVAWARRKPYLGLDHIEGHLYTPLLAECTGAGKVPPYPWLSLVVSGGHTELYRVESDHAYVHLGGTLDDAAGEAFDKIGKILGLGYPAGPRIDALVRAAATDADRHAYELPRAKVAGYDFSFSGLKTAVLTEVKRAGGSLDPRTQLRLAAPAQEAIVDALVAKTLVAAKAHENATITVTGGVACNSRLRERLPDAYFPPPKHCADNAAMIARLGAIHFARGSA